VKTIEDVRNFLVMNSSRDPNSILDDLKRQLATPEPSAPAKAVEPEKKTTPGKKKSK
jgi:hypothetical protein